MKNVKSFLFQYIVFFLFSYSFSASANVLKGIRVWPAPDETRIVMDLSQEPNYSYFTLSHPSRLVIDIRQTSKRVKLPIKVSGSPILKKVRKSTPKDSKSIRLVLDLTKSVSSEVFKLAPTPNGEYGHRLVIDLAHSNSSGSEKRTLTQAHSSTSASSPKSSVTRDASQYVGKGDVIVAIDAGHGGEDPGSIGPHGRYEKNVTLAIAKKLAHDLNKTPGVKAILTRRGDYFVSLNKRSDLARKSKAHLLVSIHADAFSSPQPRGASVFVLNTRRANTEIAKWVEDRERQSELLGGAGQVLAKNNNDPNVSQTLLDLQFSHSQKEGYKLATDILQDMGKVAYLHKKNPVNASLAVLKSPDIPSVLVETGFISNPSEEKLLFQNYHQNKLARAMSKAIVRYFRDNPPGGTLLAARKLSTKYVVKKGDSLSLIASRYGTSVDHLLEVNRLKSTSLVVGQVLLISASSPNISAPLAGNVQPKTQVITHVVKSGEFLGMLSSKYGVSVADIKRQNGLKSSVLNVGQKLTITTQLKAKPVQKYTVRRGDFLGKIARQFNVRIDSLRQKNNLKSDQLSVNQVLIIPSN
jgi:N-acetylmuramoyl-L-alanine amidase